MGCMHSKNNLPKVIDSDTGLSVQKPKYSKKTLKTQNAARDKMNKALAEVKAKGDAKLAAALAGLGGIELPAAIILQTLDEQTSSTKQTPLPEQTAPMDILKASMKIDKMSSTGIDDTEAIPVSISTDVIAKMTIIDTLSKTEELKEQTELQSAPATELSTAPSTSSRLIVVTEAKSSVDNTLVVSLPTVTIIPSKVEELTNDSDTLMSVENDAEMLVKDEKLTEELAQIMPVVERPTSSASACSRLIVVAQAKTSVDNTLDETIPAPSTPTSLKTEQEPLNQLVGSSTSNLDKATTDLVDAVFTSLDNEETVQESIVDVQSSDVINDCNMPAAMTSTLSQDQEAGFIVDSVLANITKEQLSAAQEVPQMRSTGSTAMDTEDDMPAAMTSTLSLDQEAGFIVDSVLANITKEQLSAAHEVPKMRSTGSTAMDTEDDMPAAMTSTLSLDQEAGFIVDSVLANITKEQLSAAQEVPKIRSIGSTVMDTEDDMPLDGDLHEVSSTSLEQQATHLVDAVLASISTKNESLSPLSDMPVSTRSAVDKDEITRVIIAQLKKSSSNVRNPTSQMAIQTCEISIQTDDSVIETEKPSRRSSALSKIKAAAVKSASKTSRTSLFGRKDIKSNENIKKDLKNNKSKTKCVSTKRPGPNDAKVVATKKSVNAKSDVIKKPTSDLKKSSVTKENKSSGTSTHKTSSNTDQKKSSTKPRGSAASGRMIREAANGAKVSTNVKPSKKVSTRTSSATTDVDIIENPAKNLNASKSVSFPCKGSPQKRAAKTSKPNESSQPSIDRPNLKQSTQRIATPMPPALYDETSSVESKSSRRLKQNQPSFLAPQDVASSPSGHAGGKISSVESKDSNVALISANSQDSFKPILKVQKRSGRNGSKSKVSITSDNTLRRINSASPAPGPKRSGLASVPELRPISVMDSTTDAGYIQNPRCSPDQAMGDNTQIQHESQSSVGLKQDDVTLGMSDTENQVQFISQLQQVQEMDNHSMELQSQELLLSQGKLEGFITKSSSNLVSPSQKPKVENPTAFLQITNPLSDKDQLFKTPEVVSSEGMFSPRSLVTAADSGNSTDPGIGPSLDVSKSPTCRESESPSGNNTGQKEKRASRDCFTMNQRTQGTQDSIGLDRISKTPHTRRSFDSLEYKAFPNISSTLSALKKSPSDLPNERDMGQFNCDLKSPGGITSKHPHHVRASESPRGKATPTMCPIRPASSKPLCDFFNGPDIGQSNTHGNPSNKKKPVVVIPMIPNLSKLSNGFLDELDTGQSMKVSKTEPEGTPSRSPEGRISISPRNKKMPSKTSLFSPSHNNRPSSGSLDCIDHLIQELTSPLVDKEECTPLPTYHSPASAADGETHQQQELAKLHLACTRLQH